jgi:hypothetical protein
VAGGADAELALGGLFEPADGDAGHAINDSIDCNEVRSKGSGSV